MSTILTYGNTPSNKCILRKTIDMHWKNFIFWRTWIRDRLHKMPFGNRQMHSRQIKIYFYILMCIVPFELRELHYVVLDRGVYRFDSTAHECIFKIVEIVAKHSSKSSLWGDKRCTNINMCIACMCRCMYWREYTGIVVCQENPVHIARNTDVPFSYAISTILCKSPKNTKCIAYRASIKSCSDR